MSEKCRYVCELFVITPPKSPFQPQSATPNTETEVKNLLHFHDWIIANFHRNPTDNPVENHRKLTAILFFNHCKSQTLQYTINPCNIIYYRDLSEYVKYLYLFSAVATSTAHATVHPTIGLLPIPRNPIISTWAGTEDEPANCASLCIRPMVSVIP